MSLLLTPFQQVKVRSEMSKGGKSGSGGSGGMELEKQIANLIETVKNMDINVKQNGASNSALAETVRSETAAIRTEVKAVGEQLGGLRESTESQIADMNAELKKVLAASVASDERIKVVEKKVITLDKELKKRDSKKAIEANEIIKRYAKMTEIHNPEYIYLMSGRGKIYMAEMQEALNNEDHDYFYKLLTNNIQLQGTITHLKVESYKLVDKKSKNDAGVKKHKLTLFSPTEESANRARQQIYRWWKGTQKHIEELTDWDAQTEACSILKIKAPMPSRAARKGCAKLEFAGGRLKRDKKIKQYRTKAYYDEGNNEIRASISLKTEQQMWNDIENICTSAFVTEEGVAGMTDDDLLKLLENMLDGHFGGMKKKRVRSAQTTGHTPQSKKQLFKEQTVNEEGASADVVMQE